MCMGTWVILLCTLAFLRPQVGIFATDGNFATLVGICVTCSCNFATKMVILLPRHLLTLAALLPSGKGTCFEYFYQPLQEARR